MPGKRAVPSDSPKAFIAMAGLITALMIGVVFSPSIGLIVASWRQEEYSYGAFVPLITLALLAQRLQRAELVVDGSWIGVALAAVALALTIVCTVSGMNGILPQLFILFILGAVLAVFGTRQFLWLLGPLAYLAFCAPLPRFIFADISLRLQMWSTRLSSFIIDCLGYAIYTEGNVIDLGGYKLQVVEACSGLRYLFPVMSFGYLIACLTRASMPLRAALFLSALPITVLMNSLRITLVAVTVNRWGAAMAGGFFHLFEGWVIFIACILMLCLEIRLLRLSGFRIETRVHDMLPSAMPRITWRLQSLKMSGVMLALIIMALSVSGALRLLPANQQASVAPAEPLKAFPTDIGDWHGHHEALAQETLDLLHLDDYAQIDYEKPGGEAINFYTAYYAHQDSTAAYHSPRMCIPAGGWDIESAVHKSVTVNGVTFTVNRWIIRKDSLRQVMYYWFDQRGALLTDDYEVKLRILTDALQRHATNGALVRVVTPIRTGEDAGQAEARLIDFMTMTLPILQGFLYVPS